MLLPVDPVSCLDINQGVCDIKTSLVRQLLRRRLVILSRFSIISSTRSLSMVFIKLAGTVALLDRRLYKASSRKIWSADLRHKTEIDLPFIVWLAILVWYGLTNLPFANLKRNRSESGYLYFDTTQKRKGDASISTIRLSLDQRVWGLRLTVGVLIPSEAALI